MENMEIWDKLRTPPKEVLKKITGGRLRGMTDIKPQWRYQIMTEQFGICGIGWKYKIDDQRVVDGVGEHKFAFADISLYIKDGDEWSDAIPGTGGSMLIEKEKDGPHMNDEAFKMAITDALSVAMGRIGVAADVYMGRASDSKYSGNKPSTETKKPPLAPKPDQPEKPIPKSLSQKEFNGLSLINKLKWFRDNDIKTLREAYIKCGFDTLANMDYPDIIGGIKQREEVLKECMKIRGKGK